MALPPLYPQTVLITHSREKEDLGQTSALYPGLCKLGELSRAGGEEMPWWEEMDGQDNSEAVFPEEAQTDNKAM